MHTVNGGRIRDLLTDAPALGQTVDAKLLPTWEFDLSSQADVLVLLLVLLLHPLG